MQTLRDILDGAGPSCGEFCRLRPVRDAVENKIYSGETLKNFDQADVVFKDTKAKVIRRYSEDFYKFSPI